MGEPLTWWQVFSATALGAASLYVALLALVVALLVVQVAVKAVRRWRGVPPPDLYEAEPATTGARREHRFLLRPRGTSTTGDDPAA